MNKYNNEEDLSQIDIKDNYFKITENFLHSSFWINKEHTES